MLFCEIWLVIHYVVNNEFEIFCTKVCISTVTTHMYIYHRRQTTSKMPRNCVHAICNLNSNCIRIGIHSRSILRCKIFTHNNLPYKIVFHYHILLKVWIFWLLKRLMRSQSLERFRNILNYQKILTECKCKWC